MAQRQSSKDINVCFTGHYYYFNRPIRCFITLLLYSKDLKYLCMYVCLNKCVCVCPFQKQFLYYRVCYFRLLNKKPFFSLS